ncbi:MAG: NYN domain-containing protein [Egibacteraceae bacterium]
MNAASGAAEPRGSRRADEPDAEQDPPDGLDGTAVLVDLPVELWEDLVRAFRRAEVDRSRLPTALRPFADWTPARLLADRPRRALASAIGADPALREAVRDRVDDDDAGSDWRRLAITRGEATAATLLALHARWDQLAALAAQVAANRATMARAAAEAAGPAAVDDDDDGAAARQLRRARQERDAWRRKAQQGSTRVAALEAERDRLADEVAGTRVELAALREQHDTHVARTRERLARNRRRIATAEGSSRVDRDRVAAVTEALESLAAELRAATGHGTSDRAEATATPDSAPVAAQRLPRGVAAAEPGRPCQLPAGLDHGRVEAVEALLQVAGLHVLVDGYNLTKDPRGKPLASLEQQRRWLVQLAGGVAARFGVRVTAVFDGDAPRPGAGPASRAVRVVFSAAEELADDRIVALVRGLPAATPCLVVTSDRELGERCAAEHADVVPSATFLTWAGS